jgi:hypothetical protein
MTSHTDAQIRAAVAAATARQVIAEKITKLATEAENEEVAKVIMHLAEAYGHLASEPPRTRGS